METVHLMDRMGTEPILSVEWTISINTMINFDCDGDGHGDGDGTCKQALPGTLPRYFFRNDAVFTGSL